MTCFQLYVTADPDQQLQKNLAKRNRSIGHIRSRFKIRSFFYNKQFDEFDTFRSWRLILFHGIEQKIIEKDFFKPMSISCPKKLSRVREGRQSRSDGELDGCTDGLTDYASILAIRHITFRQMR